MTRGTRVKYPSALLLGGEKGVRVGKATENEEAEDPKTEASIIRWNYLAIIG